MDASRWEEIQSTFDAVVEMDAVDRGKRLTAIGSTDPELRAAVESLLAVDSEADVRLSLLETIFLSETPLAPDPFGLAGRMISHFQVAEPIGAGGMGVVYRAVDTRLGRAVALKFLLPSFSLDARAKARFLGEARAAAALDHPNLCTIYEVGESDDGRPFLAMALYPGETLKGRLARKGSLELEEALAITRQVVEGLGCAHAARIVHRDLKPGNVMVLPDDTVKILDFGLATARDESLGGSTARLGTASYMAPEQIRGETVDGRADLWAVGVVLYEMLTGCKPFRREQDVAVAHAILHDEPTLPSTLSTEVPAAVDDIVLTLLQKERTRRFVDAAAALDALSKSPHTKPSPQWRRISLRWKRAYASFRARPRVAALALVMLGGVFTVTGIRFVSSVGHESASPPAERVAVLPFDNLSRDTANDALGRITADWISQQLANTGVIKVVPTLDVIRSTQTDISRAPHPKKDAFRAQAIALGVGTLVHGSYYRRGDTLGFQAYLFDVKHGTIEGGVPVVEGPARDPMKVVGQIAQRVSGVVAVKLDLKLDPSLARPPTFDAYRLFLDGHRETLRNNFEGALDLFLRAAASDTTFYTALYFAAAQATIVNRWPLVDSIVRVVLRSSMQLSHLDRLGLEYYRASLRGDEAGRLVIMRELARLTPGNTQLHFNVGYHAIRSNRPREAVQIARSMDPERGFLRGWFWYWPLLTGSHHLVGDHRQELREARAAVDRYPEFVELARALEIRALATDPEMVDLVRWLDDVPAPAERQEFARGYLLEIAASELHVHGRPEAAADAYRHAVASYQTARRKQPDSEEIAFNLVRSLFALGWQEEALRRASELRARFPRNVNYLGLVGTIQAARGETAEAEEIARNLEAWNEPYLFGRPSYWSSAIAAYSGDLDGALEALARAFEQGMPFWGYPNTPDFGDTHADVFLEPLRKHSAYARLVRLRG